MSLKKNILYSLILTVSTYLFPLLVYPYVSRTLGLTNIGIVNFVDNLINYFVLISMMGIMVVGVREIAVARDDKEKISRVFSSLLTLTTITTAIAAIILVLAMYIVPKLAEYRDLLYIGVVKLIFNIFLIEWFFKGIEDFKYITYRSLAVKFLYVFCIFAFIHNPEDYHKYYIITVGMVVVNAIVNYIYSKRFVSFRISNISFKPYLGVYLLMGVYFLITNIYFSVNTVWLGFATNNEEVGYYTTATKLHVIIMTVLSSFATTIFPRMSHLLSNNNYKEYWEKINTSLNAIFFFSFPCVVLFMIAGPDILHIIVGDGFEGSYTPLRIITPLVLVIGIEQILVMQILLTMHSDKIVLANSAVGALASIICNIVFTTTLGAIGSSLSWVCAECSILILSLYFCRTKHNYHFPYKKFVFSICLYAPLMLLSFWIYDMMSDSIVRIGVVSILIALYTLFVETFILKNEVPRILLKKIRK